MKVPPHEFALGCILLLLRRGEWRTGLVTELLPRVVTLSSSGEQIPVGVEIATRDDLRAP